MAKCVGGIGEGRVWVNTHADIGELQGFELGFDGGEEELGAMTCLIRGVFVVLAAMHTNEFAPLLAVMPFLLPTETFMLVIKDTFNLCQRFSDG